VSRIYVGKRKAASPRKTERAVAEAIGEWRDLEVRNALGQKFRASMQVALRRPWWMPGFFYRRLMATVVVENKLERKR
jgi:hypothetical protein